MERTEGKHILEEYHCLEHGPAQWADLASLLKVEEFGKKWREGKIVAKGNIINK